MICREHCEKVFLVDNADELKAEDFCGVTAVGITAGASTPAWIIKEVNKTMNEITNVETVMEESFEALLEQSIKTLNTGDKVTGIVTGITNKDVSVDLGTKHAGYIPYDEVSADPSVKPEDILNVGDEIEVFVVRVNDQEGTVQLSKKKLDGMKLLTPRRRSPLRVPSPRRTRAVWSLPSRASASSSPLPSPASPRAAT